MELKSLIFLLALAAGSARALVLPRDPQPSSSQQSYPNSTDISVFNGQWYFVGFSKEYQNVMENPIKDMNITLNCCTLNMSNRTQTVLALDISCSVQNLTSTSSIGNVTSQGVALLSPPSSDIDVSKNQFTFQVYLDVWKFNQQDSQNATILPGASHQMQGSLNAEYLPANGSIQEAVFFSSCDEDTSSSHRKRCHSENVDCSAALVYRQPTLDSTTFRNITSGIQLGDNAAENLFQVNNTCSA
ncbi:hypothetical protein VTP01DRAFT_5308 [Rhizomucor pusillus]|uniref:uncharacterized protein n=1 Tax=Rhizomucor pusillus TaxID=4840 RepID=UPI0037421D5D